MIERMAYVNIEDQREYQKLWIARRRTEFFADKVCVDCGSTERLELDHRDPTEKVSHKIWSWSDARREAEQAKCDIRCRMCHIERHASERRRHGVARYRAGCRCEICRAAKARAKARYLQGLRRKRAAID